MTMAAKASLLWVCVRFFAEFFDAEKCILILLVSKPGLIVDAFNMQQKQFAGRYENRAAAATNFLVRAAGDYLPRV